MASVTKKGKGSPILYNSVVDVPCREAHRQSHGMMR